MSKGYLKNTKLISCNFPGFYGTGVTPLVSMMAASYRRRQVGARFYEKFSRSFYSLLCSVYIVQWAVYSVQCTLYPVRGTLYTVQCIVYSV